MSVHPLAGKPAPAELLIDLGQLEREYYERKPDLEDPNQRVSFGTSGHRGTPLNATFTEAHILAIAQAICDFRRSRNILGPCFLGKDTHAISTPAERTALEVLAANDVVTVIQRNNGFTPTPAISHAILVWNHGGNDAVADGIVITPSHNPPADGGIKYNPPNGGPADADITSWIQERANALLREGNPHVKRVTYEVALQRSTTDQGDFIAPYVRDLGAVIDMQAIRTAGIRIGVDPLGGAALAYWEPIKEQYGLNLTVTNTVADPTFRFMSVDHDGRIRMDCSSPYAMAGLVKLSSRFDLAFGNDPDADRHGIVTPSAGLMNPNHYLAVAIDYLLSQRPDWPASAQVGKTVVSSSLIDRVVAQRRRQLYEVPVGFKWFAKPLLEAKCCFGGEESAGASFLRRDGAVWTTDKDGLILGLLAAEILARTGKDPGEQYQQLTARFGAPAYKRIDAPATPEQKSRFKQLTPDAVTATELAGEPIVAKLTRAPGNNELIGGLKVITEHGWFAARPSGTENIYKLYAESLNSPAHLEDILGQAQQIVSRSLAGG